MLSEAFFLPANPGQRYCLFHRPDVETVLRGALVYVHPFAEEMNKARRMAALQARALAAAGYAVLQIDLHGCGDSADDFADASWAGWLADVELACAWLRARSSAPLWLWGLRSGCLLAAEAAQRIEAPAGLLFWQPVVSGKQHLQQFFRLKTAGALLGGAGPGATERLRQQLAQGMPVEIAGYALAPALADGLERCELLPPPAAARCEWIELAARCATPLTPLAAARLAQWQAAGHAVRGTVVPGPAFWQTSEIEEVPALLDVTLRVLAGRSDFSGSAAAADAEGSADFGADFGANAATSVAESVAKSVAENVAKNVAASVATSSAPQVQRAVPA